MAGLINAALLDKSDVMAIEQALENELVNRAVAAGLAETPDGIVVRDIRPSEDFGTSYFSNDTWVWHASIGGNAWVKGIEKDLDNDFCVGFYGVIGPRSSTTKTVGIKFMLRESLIKDIWHIEHCRVPEAASVDMVFGIARNPVVYNPNDTVVVYLYGTGTATADTETIVLLGKVAEAVGRTMHGGVR